MKANYYYLNRCKFISTYAIGKVSPNPMVGALLVHNERIIGEGFHEYYGGPHAEVNAINSVKICDRELIPSSTLYISLEPCNFYGKTPACTQLIIDKSIKNVTISDIDHTTEVSGNSVEFLRRNNVEVNQEFFGAEEYNPVRFRNIFTRLKRPYIIVKYACSRHGYIGDGISKIWLSNAMSNRFSHLLRSYCDGILIGKQTALIDEPSLTTRLVPGKSPVKILIDPNLEVPNTNNFFNSKDRIIVFNYLKCEFYGNIEFIKINSDYRKMNQMLTALYERNIGILMVEGGTKTIQQFINQNLYDEVYEIKTDNDLNFGIEKPTGLFEMKKLFKFREDIVYKKYLNRILDC